MFIARESNTTSDLLLASSYTFSFDKRYLLVATEIQKIFRHSYFAIYDVYDTQTKAITQLTIKGSRQALMLAKFSPVDNSMILLYDGNIYYKSSPISPEIQVTTDGSLGNSILYGSPDWVYEEEVFSSNTAIWFSPNGKRIAFIRFDDTKVPKMLIPIYGEPGHPEFQYPKTLPVSYPKAAAKNPEVSLHYINVVDIKEGASTQAAIKEIPVPSRFVNEHKDHIISSVSWATDNDLIAVFMNRVQNKGDIYKTTIVGETSTSERIYDLDVNGGWIEFFTAPFYNKDGTEIIFINSVDGYRHVVSVKTSGAQPRDPRTSGKYVVNEILGVDKENNLIFYSANTESDIKAQHIYVVKNENGAKSSCLTCRKEFESYSYFTADMPSNGKHLAIIAQGPEIPRVYLTSLDSTKLELVDIMEIESNNDLREHLKDWKIPRVIYDSIQLDNGSKSSVKMVVPSDLDPKLKHPMIIDVYGGPDSSSVTNSWSIDWGTYLVSAKNYIYVRIDGRGSGLKGDEILFKLYRQLGTVEVQDQIETAKKLQSKYEYIDEKRSAIWGWSYGGYVSGMSLTNDHDNVFKCAVSVAPGKRFLNIY
jgi:dipeptidyl-peptidase 4